MRPPTAEQIAEQAYHLGLLDERQLDEAWTALGSRNVSANDFLQFMVRRGYLTKYQFDRLMKGESSGYFFGPYKVLYMVGAGTFARVFRAVHKATNQVVALKVLRRKFSDNPQQYNQFIREGELGRTLRHPNIVGVNEVCSHGRTHYLVMEFVEGWNLREFVKIRKKIAPAEALPLVTDIASGLDYAFKRGLTHRDLKMSNVLVSSAKRAKLVDFGLATVDENIMDDFTEDTLNQRAIDYAALERATGVRKDDTRSDIYFLGCILYHMLTGVPPLMETEDRLQRLNKQRFLEVEPVQKLEPSIPNSLAIVVTKAMSLEPGRRYQTPDHLLGDLEIAARRLQEDPQGEHAPMDEQTAQSLLGGAAHASKRQRSVMVVEADAKMQEAFREGFKKVDYRVLVTRDPERAVQRFQQDASTADCVIFSAPALGEVALECFNRLAADDTSPVIPAVLLLADSQKRWQSEAITNDRRAVLTMPISMKKLLQVLNKLIAATQSNADLP